MSDFKNNDENSVLLKNKDKSVAENLANYTKKIIYAIRNLDPEGKKISSDRNGEYIKAINDYKKFYLANKSQIENYSNTSSKTFNSVLSEKLPSFADKEECDSLAQFYLETLAEIRRKSGVDKSIKSLSGLVDELAPKALGREDLRAKVKKTLLNFNDVTKDVDFNKERAENFEKENNATFKEYGEKIGQKVQSGKQSDVKAETVNKITSTANIKQFNELNTGFANVKQMVESWAANNAPVDDDHMIVCFYKSGRNNRSYVCDYKGNYFMPSYNHWSAYPTSIARDPKLSKYTKSYISAQDKKNLPEKYKPIIEKLKKEMEGINASIKTDKAREEKEKDFLKKLKRQSCKEITKELR